MKCSCCGNNIKFHNDGLFVRKLLNKGMNNIKVNNICLSCKRELMFANLIEII